MTIAVLIAVFTFGLASSASAAEPKDPGKAEKRVEKKKDAAKKKADDPERKFLELYTISGKLPKKLEEAPAIITVYNQRYIRSFGYRTLTELLRVTPGFDARTASWYDSAATRGVRDASLLLIDGTPMNSNLTNYFPGGPEVDLTNFKRVQVFSGPGGALWGAHSLLGIVNLLTLDGADLPDHVVARAQWGSNGWQRYSLKAGGRWGDFDVFLATTFTTRRGPNVDAQGTTSQSASFGGRFEPGIDGRTSAKNDLYFEALGKIRYKNFTLFARVPYTQKRIQLSDEGGLLTFSDNGFRRNDNWVFYLNYLNDWSGAAGNFRMFAKVYAYRNLLQYDNRLWSANSSFPNGAGQFINQANAWKLGGLAEVSWRLNLGKYVTNKAVVGVDLLRESVTGATVSSTDANGVYGQPVPLIADATALAASGYAYDEVRLFDRVALAGGVRYNGADSYEPVTLLSANAVLRIYRKIYAKFSVAQGLRPPTLAHRFGLPPYAAPLGDYQQPDAPVQALLPETSLAYQWELNSQILTGIGPIKHFFARFDFAITNVRNIRQLESPDLDSVQYYLPRIDRDIMSAEVRVDAAFRGGHRAWLSYTYNRAVHPAIPDEPAAQTGPRNAWSAGVSVRAWTHLRFMAQGSVATGTRASLLQLNAGSVEGGSAVKFNVDPIVLVNAGIFAERLYRDLSLSLVVYNLLNWKYSNYVFTNIGEKGGTSTGQAGQALKYQQPGFQALLRAQMSF